MVKDTECKGTVGPDFPLDRNGNPIQPDPNAGCDTRPDGRACPPTPKDNTCRPFQLSRNRDSCFVDGLVNEALNIGGADLNVYKLLGVHEQGKLVDVTGMGQAISNGDAPGFPASNAFDVFVTEWRSIQSGPGLTASSFIGYDFGEIKTVDKSWRVYGIEANIRKHITAISIKQSNNPENRVTRARIERSEDGMRWYGVSVVLLPDDDCLNTVLFRNSVPSRYWRIRPLDFNGGATDYWGVQALQMFHNYVATDEYNVQDKVFLENRDRDYSTDPLLLKGSYDLIDVQSELLKMGIELPAQTFYVQVSFSACVAILGRPLVIGDIVEIPSETQFSAKMEALEKWMEVTDVAWSTEGYTPGWQPTLLRVVMQPAYVSQETQDIFGDLAENEVPGGLGLLDKGDGNHPIFQDYSDVSQTIEAEAKDAVPEKGREFNSTVRAWEEEEVRAADDQGLGPTDGGPSLQRIGLRPNALYVEDAMPANNEPFTEGTEFPTSPQHGDYHRLTYDVSFNVPARLYRYSSSKGRWIFLEKDRRAEFNPDKPTLQEFLTSGTRRPHTHILRDEEDC